MSSTLFRLLQESVLKFPSLAALREIDREGQPRVATFAELYTWVTELGTGLIDLGLKPGQRVALVAEPGSRWLTASLATLGCRAVLSTGAPDLTEEDLQDLLCRCQPEVVFVEDRKAADRVLSLRRRLKPSLRDLNRVILLKSGSGGGRFSLWRLFALPLFTWEEVLARGREKMHDGDHRFDLTAAGIAPQETAACHYLPAGWGASREIRLSHEAVLNGIAAVQKQLDTRGGPDGPRPGARWLTALPVGHPGELFIQSLCLRSGSTLVYSRPVVERVLRDLRQEQPECLVASPQVLHALHRRILSGSRIRSLFYLSEVWQILRRQLRSQFPVGRSVWKIGRGLIYLIPLMVLSPLRLVSGTEVSRVRKVFLGGKLRTVISVASGLTPQSRRLFSGLGIHVLETDPGLDVEGGGSFLKGFKRAAPAGREPAREGLLEDRLSESPWIQEAVLMGADGQAEPKLLVYPRIRALRVYAAEHGLPGKTDAELIEHPQIRRLFQEEVERRTGKAWPLEILSSVREIRRIRLEELIDLSD